MRGRRGVAESGAVPAGGRDMNSESFIRPLPSQCSAAPHAGMRLARSGTRKSSSGSPRWLMKACLRAGMKVSGPPQKRMPGFSSQPWERVVTVCTATAWKMDAAMSVFGTFLLIRFCTSVLEKTPHREAMGCIWVACPASVSSSSISVPSSRAIWSMNAPVPPAQLPFIAQVGLSVVAQIDDFRIFAAYVYDGRYAVFPLPYVLDGGDYLLYERYRETFRNTHSDRPRHRYPPPPGRPDGRRHRAAGRRRLRRCRPDGACSRRMPLRPVGRVSLFWPWSNRHPGQACSSCCPYR